MKPGANAASSEAGEDAKQIGIRRGMSSSHTATAVIDDSRGVFTRKIAEKMKTGETRMASPTVLAEIGKYLQSATNNGRPVAVELDADLLAQPVMEDKLVPVAGDAARAIGQAEADQARLARAGID